MIIKRLIYRAGLRPKRGSIFYSPSLALVYASRLFAVEFEKAVIENMERQFDGEDDDA